MLYGTKIINMKSGSTLIEVMFSIFILAVLAIAGASMLSLARNNLTTQKQRRIAIELANNQIESWRSLLTGVTPTNITTTSVVGGHSYSITNSISQGTGGTGDAPTNSFKLTVDVTYSGANDYITLTTILSDLDK